jgi:phenylacetate-CoA ligase
VAASLRGYYLRAWRYGSDAEEQVDSALERDRWSPAQWKSWTEERLAFVLHRAARDVPFYREQWAARRRRGDRSSPELLENWPLLDKDEVRNNPRSFLADDCDPRKMFYEHTSGTTGKSLDLWWSRDTVKAWYALLEARARRWYGISRHDRWAIFGGQIVIPVANRKPPFWVWNSALNQLYMSSYHLAPDLIPHYLDALERYQVRYLLGYPSSLCALATSALEQHRTDLKMAVAVTNAEPVFDRQRDAISQAFGCPVRETYGMVEAVAAGSECEHGGLHLWPEAGVVEVIGENGQPRGDGSGELICTGLLNADMPLIRYRVGDRGTVPQDMSKCDCGRSLPLIDEIVGRVADVLYTADGREIGAIDTSFPAHLPVREAQIIQEHLGSVKVRYVPTPDYTDSAGQSLVDEIRARMGPIEVALERVSELPRGPNGKLHAVVCSIKKPQAYGN